MNSLKTKKTDAKRRREQREADELGDKIMYGLSLAYERLVERTRKNNGTLVVMKDGKIIEIKP